MKKKIEFENGMKNPNLDPWKSTASKTYCDELLRAELVDRQLKLREGENWMRIVPAMRDSSEDWMMGLHTLATPTGKFLHPRTYEPSARGVWDAVYGNLKKNEPEKLYSKANRDGLRLLPTPMTLCWVITGHGGENEYTTSARLLILSGYSGERGGSPGLGYQILQMASDKDEDGELSHDISGVDGVRICLEKRVTKESKYPRYILRAGRQPIPIDELIANLPDSEATALQPLENVVRHMSDNEQWERLARLMPESEVATIRNAMEM